MATTRKPGRPGQSLMGYFRTFFHADPTLIHTTSNEAVITQWKQDHPKHSPKELARARQNLANLKSLLRRKERERNGQLRRTTEKSLARSNATAPPRGRLEILEAQIDDCLLFARNLDPVGLESVIKRLRLARNEVVLKLG